MSRIAENREQLVVKSNLLIQKSRYDLSTQEQKLLLYIISKIKPTDTSLSELDFDLRELCEVCGLQAHGQNYDNFRTVAQSLRDKSFWLETKSTITLVSWVSKVKIYKSDTRVTVSLDKDLEPYLLQLRESFTTYELEYILGMKSKYAIRLYELMKSYVHIGEYSTTVEDLKLTLQTPEYEIYNNFKVKVIDKALSEINALTDITVTYAPVRQNRKIVSLNFLISRKKPDESFAALCARHKSIT